MNTPTFNRFCGFALPVLLTVALTGCDDNEKPQQVQNPAPQAQQQAIAGGGIKGPLANSPVTAYALDTSAPGFMGSMVGEGTTNNAAAIVGLTLPDPADPPYILEFTSVKGETTDLTTGAYPVIETLRTVITQALLDSGEPIYATPLTTMAVDLAIRNADSTTPPWKGDGDGKVTRAEFEAALAIAATQVKSTLGFGIGQDVDIFDTPPLLDDTTVSEAQQAATAAYRAAVEAFTAVVYEMDQQSSGDIDAVIDELTADLGDGEIDGKVNGAPSTVLNDNALAVLDEDPATLTIPGTSTKVAEVKDVLVNEQETTGSKVDSSKLKDVTPTKAQKDPDLDDDGVANADDAFPNDPNETKDSDGDGVGDNGDAFPNDPDEQADSDGDGVGDNGDAFPNDPNETTDSDGDGVGNNADDFPNNPNETTDTDGDRVGDNSDAFPNDPNETADSDGDGVGDNADAFPNDPNETSDSDGDGIGDNADVFPNNPGESADSDGDGVGDNADAFPNDPNETTDSDGDGVGDNSDVFPNDPNESVDSDNDGVGDNADAFPNDPNETTDSDNDGVGDNSDAFPNDPNEQTDTDGDGVGDNSDAFPNDPNETADSDGDGVGDNADDLPNDPNETVDSDGDGVGDNSDVFPNDPNESADSDGDGVGDNADAFPNDPNETVDTDGDGVGDNSDAFPADPNETIDSDGDGVGDNSDDFPFDDTETTDSDGDGVGDNADAFPNDNTETTDSDGDGVGDNGDAFPNDPNETIDSDADGVGDNGDNCPANHNPMQEDFDQDGIGDACDVDQPYNATGVYRIDETTTNVMRSGNPNPDCFGDSQNGDVETFHVSLQQTDFNLLASSGSPDDVAAAGVLDPTDNSFELNSIVNETRNGWTSRFTFNLTGTYDPANRTFSAQIAEREQGSDQGDVNDQTGAWQDCTYQADLTGAFVYRHDGTEDYNGMYGLEFREQGDDGETDRGNLPAQFEIAGNSIVVYLPESSDQVTASAFDPNTGLFSMTLDNFRTDEHRDNDNVPDLVCDRSLVGGLFLRAPGDTSGPMVSLRVEGTGETHLSLGGVTPDPSICFDGMTQPNEVDHWEDEIYGKQLTSTPVLRVFSDAADDDQVNERHFMGINNPPLKRASVDSMLRLSVSDGGAELCSRTYDRGFRTHGILPYGDFDQFAFQQQAYANVSCDTGGVVDTGAYTLRIFDDNATPGDGSDDLLAGEFPLVASLASPVPDATQRVARRQIDFNGVQASMTEIGDPISLYGFFNPHATQTVSWPAITDADDYYLDLDESHERVRRRAVGSATSVMLPPEALADDDATLVRLRAVYNTASGIAHSRSRNLLILPGLNAVMNVELDNAQNLDLANGSFQIQFRTLGEDVFCVVTNSDALVCNDDPSDANFPLGHNPSAIDWDNNQVQVELIDQYGDFGGGRVDLTLTFSDSGNATVDLAGWSGMGLVVNPELTLRSQLRGDGSQRGLISFNNPLANYPVAELNLANGTFDGVNSDVRIYDGIDQLFNSFDSYRRLPIGDDGNGSEPQRVGVYVSGTYTDNGARPPADILTATLSGELSGLPDKQFQVVFASPDPSGLAAPSRDQVTIELSDGSSFTGDGHGSVGTAMDIADHAVTSVSWISTLGANGMGKWEVQARLSDNLGNGIPHAALRSPNLSEAAMTFDPTTDTWTWNVPGTDTLTLDPGEIAHLRLRYKNADNTALGETRKIFLQGSAGN